MLAVMVVSDMRETILKKFKIKIEDPRVRHRWVVDGFEIVAPAGSEGCHSRGKVMRTSAPRDPVPTAIFP